MTLKKCILTENDCYKKGTKIANGKPKGIVVHSTGANNPYLKRYVQPLKSYKDYNTIINELGTKTYGNHWNRTGTNACVHAFIGKTANGSVASYQILPFDFCCWGSGSGAKGSYNTNPNARIQFEICEDGLSDEKYFTDAFNEAAAFCVYICKEYNLTADMICSHKEAYAAQYATNHGDPDHWLKKFGKNMNDFRKMVDMKLAGNTDPVKPVTSAQTNVVDSVVKNNTASGSKTVCYLVKVKADVLNIRSGPGTSNKITGKIVNKGTYTIVMESDGQGASKWGRLKSGAGWISLDYCSKV